ncbi:MAG: DUF899 domain-containing protein [Marinosulfonomonas sp.]|nr:DUF899 domain-containing protein [Marinosulfonomonas sp.]
MAITIASRQDWLEQRKNLLEREKEFNRTRDALSAARRELPWVRIEKDYQFDGKDGAVSLGDLFGAHSQLVVYHFMFAPDWQAGCKSCSFWMDNFEGTEAHLGARDTALAMVSSAPLETLQKFRERMGWTMPWVSAGSSNFNQDFGVTFSDQDVAEGNANYNYRTIKRGGGEMPGVSVFSRDDNGAMYHTYSTYSRGLDMLNGAYHILDLTPKGRNEGALDFTMSWLQLHDQY